MNTTALLTQDAVYVLRNPVLSQFFGAPLSVLSGLHLTLPVRSAVQVLHAQSIDQLNCEIRLQIKKRIARTAKELCFALKNVH